MNKIHSGFNLLKLYFSIISIVGILGTVISIGIAGYSWLNQLFITDAEYVAGNDSRKMQQCEEQKFYPTNKPIVTDEINTSKKTKTLEEIKICKNKATQRIILQRHLNIKETTISGIVRGIIFLLLFLSHYPRMVKQHEEINITKKKSDKKINKKNISKRKITKK